MSRSKIYTKEFKEWFGDWENEPENSSKVVDDSGYPLVVFHGTKTKGFNSFKWDNNKQTGDNRGEVYYFTSSKDVAIGYAHNVKDDPRYDEYSKEHDRLIRQILSDPNNKDYRKQYTDFKNKEYLFHILETPYITKDSELKSVYLDMKNPYYIQGGGKNFREVYPDSFDELKKNYDGVIVYDVQDNAVGEEVSDIYIVFSPNQIKSVDNKGTFSNDTYNIYESMSI